MAFLFGESPVTDKPAIPLRQHAHHPRTWRENSYVYPVISRRSGGLSIGVNLNPDTACNFDCIYCQVNRTVTPRTREVRLDVLEHELASMLAHATSGDLLTEPEFQGVPTAQRIICDVAFSGDGEPTTCREFPQAVELAARQLHHFGLTETKIVLITDASYLTKPHVVAGLEIMDRANGEIWAKLDAGTESYFQLINRPNFSLQHVVDNIITAARVRPVVIQSLFMRVHEVSPSADEIAAYLDRLEEIRHAGGQIKLVQVYTIARRPAQTFVTPLSQNEVDHIVQQVRSRIGVSVEPYYGAG